MSISAWKAATLAMVAAGLSSVALAARAQTYERPPAFDVARLKSFNPQGENYTITNPVRSDGLLRLYSVTTPYGDFVFQGDQMMRMRVTELAALTELEKITSSESYGKALVNAGLSPL